MIYLRVAFIVALFALTVPGSAHAQQAVTPAPQTVTPRACYEVEMIGMIR
jgi:hypothetical protein